MNYVKLIFYGILFQSSIFQLNAQSTLPSSGGNAGGLGGTSSYTVGQVFYHTIFGEVGSVAEGVQHPFIIETPTSNPFDNIQLNASVYPNPTFDVLNLSLTNMDIDQLSYRLYDSKGKLYATDRVQQESTLISFEKLAASTYFLIVDKDGSEIKSFKILKTN